MKIALLTDTHLGVRNNNKAFHDNNEKFFTNIVFPALRERGITNIIHLGDVFHNRFNIDIETLRRAREYFLEPINKDFMMHIIAGNHDLYWKESSDTNTLREIVHSYDSITFHTSAIEVGNALFVPWINKQNREHTMKAISDSSAKYVFGHLELKGFSQNHSHISTHGDDPSIFSKFIHVYTGHFHCKSTKGNITYLGSNQQHDWGDCGDQRGFHIWDSKTNILEFIANPDPMYMQIVYDPDNAMKVNGADKHIRIKYDAEKVTQSTIDKFVEFLETSGALSVKSSPIQSTLVLNQVNEQLTSIDVEDTATVFKTLIADQAVYGKFMQFYHQALIDK